MDETSPFAGLAIDAIVLYVSEGETLPVPSALPEEMTACCGVFVCIKKYGELRGCIGTIEPMCDTVAEEIIQNAINAAMRDPRFLPVEPEELELLSCSVDVLTHPEPVDGFDCLDPARYGVIVECNGRRGLLLPDLDGVDTVEDQVSIACRKAGIRHRDGIQLYRFEVKRYD